MAASDLEAGAQTICTACSLSNALLAVCSDSGEVSIYTAVEHKAQWSLSCKWQLNGGRPVQVRMHVTLSSTVFARTGGLVPSQHT